MGSPAGGGGLDDGIQNLQQFIGIVMSTIEQVEAHTTTLEEHAHGLDELDQQADTALAELDSALDQLEGDLTAAERDAVEEIGALGQEAHAGADEALAEAGNDLGRAESDFTTVLGESRSRLTAAGASLMGDGFKGLEARLESAEAALTEDGQEVETSFSALETSIGDLLGRAEGFFSEVEASVDEALGVIADRGSVLEADAEAAVAGLAAAGTDIDGECRILATIHEGIYKAWTTYIESIRLDFRDSLATVIQETGGLVDASEARMGEAAETVEDTLDAYLGDLSEAHAVFERAEQQASSELVPLVEQLEIALAVVKDIDALMDALES